MLSAERHCLLQFRYNGSPFRGPRNPDRPPTPHLEESLISEKMESSENGIGIDAKYRRQVLGLRNFLPRQCLALCDGSSNLGGNLIMK